MDLKDAYGSVKIKKMADILCEIEEGLRLDAPASTLGKM